MKRAIVSVIFPRASGALSSYCAQRDGSNVGTPTAANVPAPDSSLPVIRDYLVSVLTAAGVSVTASTMTSVNGDFNAMTMAVVYDDTDAQRPNGVTLTIGGTAYNAQILISEPFTPVIETVKSVLAAISTSFATLTLPR